MPEHARDLERRLRETVIERDELLHLNGVQADNVRSERRRAEAAERERDALKEELASVKADAERLDFYLAWTHTIGEESDPNGGNHTFYLADNDGEYHGKTWREAIDKARAAKGGKT